MEKNEALKELTKNVHIPSFCAEEGYCEALDDCAAIDVGECSCCNINRIVRAFNRGIEFQKQKSKSSWISVNDVLPCNHEEMVQTDFTKLLNIMDKKEMPKIFTIKEIESFIRVHFQSKIDHNELEQIGFDMTNANNFEKQYEFYKRTLFEGICNGILMCGGKIEGVDDGES